MRTPDHPIVYCVYREGPATVLASQVLTPLRRLAEAGRDVRLCAHVPVGQMLRRAAKETWRRAAASLPESARKTLVKIPSAPNRARRLWPDGPLFSRWLASTFDRDEPFVLHCRGTAMTLLAARALARYSRAKLIYDCRGAERAEYLYERGLENARELPSAVGREADRLERSQIEAARVADAVVCVSERMADFLVESAGVARGKITVIPCCVDVESFVVSDEARARVRDELGLGSRFVVTYAGSLRRWQQPERSVALFRSIQRVVPGAHLLMLTTQPGSARTLVESQGLEAADVTIHSAPHSEVPRYLAASDVTLLLREDSLVNRVASPVKFGEYLACGTPVVMSEGIGDYSALAEAEEVGLVLPQGSGETEIKMRLEAFLSAYRENPGEWRARCRRTAVEQLSAELHLERVRALYDRLSGMSDADACVGGRASSSESRTSSAVRCDEELVESTSKQT